MATTRLLLPFTGSINTQALNYAIQLAEHRQATLVPLALIRVEANKAARLEHVQQAQDFLEFTRSKAERHGVPIEQARIYTSDAARSIEAVAGEMNCEAVLLFLCARDEALLEPAEISTLMDYAACNAYIVLLSPRRERKHPLYVPLLKRPGRWITSTKPGTLLDVLARE
jgi:hypothetical protein